MDFYRETNNIQTNQNRANKYSRAYALLPIFVALTLSCKEK